MNRKIKDPVGKILLILLLISVFLNPLRSGEKVKWYSFEKGSRVSYKTKKPLLIFFHSELCVYCKKMLHESFSDQSVIKRLNESYVPVILNLDRNEKNISYNKERISAKDLFFIFQGNALPYIIFFDSSKSSIITSIPGYIDKRMFAPLLEYIKAKCYERKISFQDYMGEKGLCDNL